MHDEKCENCQEGDVCCGGECECGDAKPKVCVCVGCLPSEALAKEGEEGCDELCECMEEDDEEEEEV